MSAVRFARTLPFLKLAIRSDDRIVSHGSNFPSLAELFCPMDVLCHRSVLALTCSKTAAYAFRLVAQTGKPKLSRSDVDR